MEYVTNNPSETVALGEQIAHGTLSEKLSTPGAVVLSLEGDLGAGKTTFIQGFGRGLGIRESILSPTFIIMNRYGLKKGKFKDFYHFDCYRVEEEKEVEALEFEEIISNPRNIVCIEWGERIKNLLPGNIIIIKFKASEKDKRKIKIFNYGE